MIIWDEPKRAANLEKHGLDFADAPEFDWAGAFVIPARDGRQKAIGLFRGRVIAIVFKTLGTQALAMISMRRAGKKERRLFDDNA